MYVVTHSAQLLCRPLQSSRYVNVPGAQELGDKQTEEARDGVSEEVGLCNIVIQINEVLTKWLLLSKLKSPPPLFLPFCKLRLNF